MRIGLAALATAAALATTPAAAAIQTLDFSGYFGGGSAPGFPQVSGGVPTITGQIVYDTANGGFVTPDNFSFTNPDSSTGTSANYHNSILSFSFQSSINGGVGFPIGGSFTSASGVGDFIVWNNLSGLDALAPTVYASQGLTGTAPTGYSLVSAGFYFFSSNRILGSNALPGVSTSTAPYSAFLPSGPLFIANFTDGSNPLTIYANITTTAVPEPSTWALMLLGFAGLGFASYRAARKTAAAAA